MKKTDEIAHNLKEVKKKIPQSVTLVAVSKTKPIEDIIEAYNAGQKVFGENKVQELEKKFELLPKDITWHFIGHLQRNKVKYIAPFVSLIHAVDSLKLLKEINKQAHNHNRIIDCLIQIKIAKEDTKFGINPSALSDFIQSAEIKQLENVNIIGLMGMATNTSNIQLIESEFNELKKLFDQFNHIKSFKVLSMGMSSDYPIAIQQGSTMVRVGSSIFGARNYAQ